MTLDSILRGSKGTYFCENPMQRSSNEPQAILRQAYGGFGEGFYVKSWEDTTISRAQFESEAVKQLMPKGMHPNILLPVEVIENNEGNHFVYPFLEGVTLGDYTDSSPPERDFQKVLYVLESVASGLEHIHAFNIVHRDVKPDNIFLKSEADVPYGFRPILFDWDTAGKWGDVVRYSMGTPAFMAPEAIVFGSRVQRSFDQYSLGSVIYRMLDGDLPVTPVDDVVYRRIVNESLKDFEEACNAKQKEVYKLLFAHLEPYRRPLVGEGIPEAVGHVVDRMVKCFAKDRFGSLNKMVGAFREAIEGKKEFSAAQYKL